MRGVDVEALRKAWREAEEAFEAANEMPYPATEMARSDWHSRREAACLRAVADLAAAYANGRAIGLEQLADRERDARIEERCQLTERAERAEAERDDARAAFDESEEARAAAVTRAENERDFGLMQRERAERAEAALRDLARAASEVARQTSIDAGGQGYVWGGYVRTLIEATRRAEVSLDEPIATADTLPPAAPEAEAPVVELDDVRDERWLTARARGESVEHSDPARAASYERIERALAEQTGPTPPRGWQARVLEEIAKKGEE